MREEDILPVIEHRRYGTAFLESEALLALTADDEEYAEQVLRSMTRAELSRLSQTAGLLGEMARSAGRRAEQRMRAEQQRRWLR